MSDHQQRPGRVQSLDRALDLLEALAAGRPLGVIELARQVGLAQGTVHRLLGGLQERGYVSQDGDRRYRLGLAAARLADGAHQELTRLAQPHLRDLAQTVGETANLAVLDGAAMVYIAQSPSPHTLRIFAEVGRRVPVHSTAVGKAVLAGLDPARATELLASLDLTARTPHTLVTGEAIAAELESVQRAGYAIDEQEQELGVRCVAALLPTPHLEAAISVSGPTERFSPDQARQASGAVIAAAATLAADLTPTP